MLESFSQNPTSTNTPRHRTPRHPKATRTMDRTPAVGSSQFSSRAGSPGPAGDPLSAACCKAIFLWSSCSCVCPSRISFAFACWPRPLHSCLAPHTANNHSSNAQRPHLHDEPLSAKFGVVSANFSPIDASGELPSFNYRHSLDRLLLLVSNSLTYSPYNSMNKIGTLLHWVHAFLCFFVRVF